MASEVLFMRHPETMGNTRHVYSGRLNVELSDLGAKQCVRAIEALVAWRPDRIVTSPLIRCRSIAYGAALALGLTPEVDERVVEIDFGAIEGKTAAEAAELGISFPWPQDPTGRSLPAPDAESFEHLIARAAGFLDDARTWEGRVAVVTHGGYTRAVMAAAYGMPLAQFWNMRIDNVSSQIFEGDGQRLRLKAFGLTPMEVTLRGRMATGKGLNL